MEGLHRIKELAYNRIFNMQIPYTMFSDLLSTASGQLEFPEALNISYYTVVSPDVW